MFAEIHLHIVTFMLECIEAMFRIHNNYHSTANTLCYTVVFACIPDRHNNLCLGFYIWYFLQLHSVARNVLHARV